MSRYSTWTLYAPLAVFDDSVAAYLHDYVASYEQLRAELLGDRQRYRAAMGERDRRLSRVSREIFPFLHEDWDKQTGPSDCDPDERHLGCEWRRDGDLLLVCPAELGDLPGSVMGVTSLAWNYSCPEAYALPFDSKRDTDHTTGVALTTVGAATPIVRARLAVLARFLVSPGDLGFDGSLEGRMVSLATGHVYTAGRLLWEWDGLPDTCVVEYRFGECLALDKDPVASLQRFIDKLST